MKRPREVITDQSIVKACKRDGELGQEMVLVVENVLESKEIEILKRDIDLFRKVFTERVVDNDLGDYGAAIDPFEFQDILPNSLIRSDQDEYMEARWKAVESVIQENATDIKSTFSSLAFSKIPQIIQKYTKKACSISKLYLFNEQYIVKDVGSRIAFRWHRDADEQFSASIDEQKPLYYSAWCNLDSVSSKNGTIAFKSSANIVRIGHEDQEHHSNLELVDFLPSLYSASECPTEDEAGMELCLPQGSLVIFGSHVWHRSGVNEDDSSRSVFYAQYSTQPITLATSTNDKNNEETSPISFAIPINI